MEMGWGGCIAGLVKVYAGRGGEILCQGQVSIFEYLMQVRGGLLIKLFFR